MPLSELFVERLSLSEPVPEDRYYAQLPAVRALSEGCGLTLHSQVTFFVGENGSGKSTLLEAAAVKLGFNPEGGTANYLFSTHDSHGDLWKYLAVARGIHRPKTGYFLRAESFYNVATAEAEYSQSGGTPQHLHEKSHGESFLATVQNNFRPGGVYFLDEPEAALSPQRQLTLLREIYACAQSGAQFIMVTHSPILLGLPDAAIFSFDDGPLHPVSYEDTDSFRITSLFLSDRKRMLHSLLEE